ncbi:MAG: PAS domain-containing protein [Alphaproteobacteria bacterium]|jgi:hypothetical protein|nr:PAS domain-containing protein [Alphaproteobacteria bacterium]MDP6588303.1 PAS domain-containing protein [Alphaproteobacteria bacterium]MDP6819586.1 PAS domain-containing protein [Alphaproteobacteria bacterium]|tara:strand:- start:843 stop:1439 length:597 start_codon:yes stop_codon:yes gene_type:complete
MLQSLIPGHDSRRNKGGGTLKRKLASTVAPSGRERFFGEDDIIVSKTDIRGHITYANDIFLNVALMRENQAIGAPHSVIRHPDMPRAVFKLLWDTLEAGNEIFAYVKNMALNGDHYWVFAHATPSFDDKGTIIGYHSNRRVPDRPAVEFISGLYDSLLAEEQGHTDRKQGMEASFQMLVDILKEKGVSYDEFVFSLQG